jgi:hypothetical protein
LVLKLASNESEKSSPKVSKLPLPISDSPLVIDLPDGQKIVIGKMTLGSVIEVATWRGVGRPDSRTSRLMLGMGSGNVNEDSDSGDNSQVQERKAPVKPKGFAGFIFSVQHFVKNFNRINWSGTAKALLSSATSKKSKKVAKSEQVNEVSPTSVVAPTSEVKPEVTISRASEDADIEEWLNTITQKTSRETTVKKPVAKSSGSSASKAKVRVKKAAPKASNPRSTKR